MVTRPGPKPPACPGWWSRASAVSNSASATSSGLAMSAGSPQPRCVDRNACKNKARHLHNYVVTEPMMQIGAHWASTLQMYY